MNSAAIENGVERVETLSIVPPQTLHWPFIYRAYSKKRCIQLKPAHDKTNHFSIIWSKNKTMTLEEFKIMDAGIRAYLTSKTLTSKTETKEKCEMTFRIIKACKNCTYGRFEQEFEDLIIKYRNTYQSVSKEKDLNLGLENRNAHLKTEEIWDDEHPIFHHIHNKIRTEDEAGACFNDFLSYGPRNSILTLDIIMTETE